MASQVKCDQIILKSARKFNNGIAKQFNVCFKIMFNAWKYDNQSCLTSSKS